jgi:hypothetical protein
MPAKKKKKGRRRGPSSSSTTSAATTTTATLDSIHPLYANAIRNNHMMTYKRMNVPLYPAVETAMMEARPSARASVLDMLKKNTTKGNMISMLEAVLKPGHDYFTQVMAGHDYFTQVMAVDTLLWLQKQEDEKKASSTSASTPLPVPALTTAAIPSAAPTPPAKETLATTNTMNNSSPS